MGGLEHIGGSIRSTLADAYRQRAQTAGPWRGMRTSGEIEVFAAALLARDLMAGDAETFKAGYSRENAMLAAVEMFPAIDASDTTLGEALDDLRPVWRFVVEERAWTELEAREALQEEVADRGWRFDLEARVDPEEV